MLVKRVRRDRFFSLSLRQSTGLAQRLQQRYSRYFKGGGKRNRKEDYLDKEIYAEIKHWNDLIYQVCKGDPVRMKELRKYDIFDFYLFVEAYQQNIKNGGN